MRFAKKAGFGERRRDAKPVSMKIFLLPNVTTQSPRNAHLGGFGDAQQPSRSADRRMRELKKQLRRSRFLQY
jgi:hypothetical protein